MHSLRRFLKLSYLRTSINRKFTSKVEHKETLSVRQRAWLEAQQQYAPFAPHIVYSSYIENPVSDLPKVVTQNDFPKHWMDDYEFYRGDDGIINSKHGTADPNISASNVPCNGCGANLHCASFSLPGYLPKEIFSGRTEKELKTIVCQRCHFLKHYNIALDVDVSAESYVQTLATIKDKFALALVIVDLLDFPCSIWPGMGELLGPKRPVFVVGNKVDLLPRDSNGYLERVKKCLKEQIIRHGGLNKANIKHIGLISAKTGYGIEELITQLHKVWKFKGDVYLIGCTNVGKSSLFNILLNSDYCRPEASQLIRKATTCPWPGTTLHMLRFPIFRPSEIRIYHRFQRLFSEQAQKAAEEKLRQQQAKKTGSIQAAQLIGKVGRTFDGREDVNDVFAMSAGTNPIITLDERSKNYRDSKWCYDTPGVLHPDQVTDLLTTDELLSLQPKEMITPRAFRLHVGSSIFLGGLGRLDFLKFISAQEMHTNAYLRVLIFASLNLPIVISPTEHANEMYKKYLGTKLLGIPFGMPERLERWPGLTASSTNLEVCGGDKVEKNCLDCDIVISSIGWIGLNVPANSTAVFKAWTPRANGIHLRTPPLIPFAERLIGKRIRYSYAYHTTKPFVFRK